MTWDERWMSMAALVASWSKDRSHKVGAVVVDNRNVLRAVGWNGFPRGLADQVEYRYEKPAKYFWTEHAERNAIFNAAAEGIALKGCRMYVQWFPCADCARGIIQSGICEIICVESDWLHPTWGPSFKAANTMFREAGIKVRFFPEPPIIFTGEVPF